jgi:hypothetical protein
MMAVHLFSLLSKLRPLNQNCGWYSKHGYGDIAGERHSQQLKMQLISSICHPAPRICRLHHCWTSCEEQMSKFLVRRPVLFACYRMFRSVHQQQLLYLATLSAGLTIQHIHFVSSRFVVFSSLSQRGYIANAKCTLLPVDRHFLLLYAINPLQIGYEVTN